MTGVSRDLKVAFRQIRMHPVFSLLVAGMLAIGIAANAAIFSIFDGLFLRPLPFPESDRMVELDETAPQWNLRYVGVANQDFDEWRRSNSTFSSMAFFAGAGYNLSEGNAVERVRAAQVTREMLDVLRLQPVIGRGFKAEEDRPGGAKVVLLSFGLWQRLFHLDRQVVGRMIRLDEQPHTVIGVLPPGAVFPDRVDVWTPLAADVTRPSGYYLNGIGRLKPGVSIAQAQSDLARVHKAMVASGRRVNEITSPVVTPLRDRYLGNFKMVSRVLLAAVGMVLLMACVNIAALIMVRGSARSREIAIRNAMGASHGRIAAQLLLENLVLALAGAALGIPLGAAGLRVIVAQMPDQVPQWITFTLDWRFAVFCLMVTGTAALVFGLAPVLHAARVDIRESLQNSATRMTATRGRHLALGTFMVCEVALALILSTSAGLLAEAFRRVLQADPGFRPDHVLSFAVSLPDTTYDRPEQKIAYYTNLLGRLRELPGLRAAGATSSPPLGGRWGGQFEAEGGRPQARDENPVVLRVAATPGYFEAIGSTLLAGRTFEERDCLPNSALVAIVNEAFAKHFWPAGNPIGERIRYPGAKEWYEVIGLLRDERHDGLDQAVTPTAFLPYSTALFKSGKDDLRSLRLITFVLRGSGDPGLLAGPARELARQVDPDVPMYAIQSMKESLDQSLWARRAYSWLFGLFATIATLLAAAGVYGTVSYSVSQRRQEVGLRIALGARPAQVLAEILRSGMALVAIGIAAGITGTFWSARLLEGMLFGGSSRDPGIYGAVAGGIAIVAFLANFLPARRAASVDPMKALRAD